MIGLQGHQANYFNIKIMKGGVKSMENDKTYIVPNLEKGIIMNENIITIAASNVEL